MAKMAVLIFLCFSLIISSVLSRTLPLSSKTTVLDITPSLQKTRNVFSLNNSQPINALENQESSFSSTSSSSSLSFELHSRVGFRQFSDIVDYKSLTLARLECDSARVKSLQTRVHMAVHGTQLDADKVLRGPVTSGTSQGAGEYFTRVGIGSPPRRVFLALDTGSDVTWLQCAPCADCYQQVDPIFQPASSSSFSPLSCESQQCRSLDVSQCGDGTCQYEVDYGDGSSTEGDLVTETITFGGSAPVNNMAIGCGHDNHGLFAGAAGLIGLGGGPLSFPSQIKATSFSYCFVDPDSDASSTLDFNAATPTDAVTVPLLRNPKIDTFRYVDLTGISVAGELLSIPPSSFKLKDNGDGGVVIDSGTTLTLLQTEAYNVLRDAFLKGTKNLPLTNGVSGFDTCYDLASRTSVEMPTVSFHFSNGEELVLPAKGYLFPVDSTGTFCFAFVPSSLSLSIFGNWQQQGTRVSYDLANSLIGFSPNKC